MYKRQLYRRGRGRVLGSVDAEGPPRGGSTGGLRAGGDGVRFYGGVSGAGDGDDHGF